MVRITKDTPEEDMPSLGILAARIRENLNSKGSPDWVAMSREDKYYLLASLEQSYLEERMEMIAQGLQACQAEEILTMEYREYLQ